MSYPTLASETIVERKGDDVTDRKSHLVIDHAEVKADVPKDEPAEPEPVEHVEHEDEAKEA